MTLATSQALVAADAAAEARALFIRRTYGHLAGAVLAFLALEALLFQIVPGEKIVGMLTGWNWLLVLGAFMVVGWVADKWAHSRTSVGMQYLGLGLYVVAEAAIFLPLLYVAAMHSSPDVIPTAGIITVGMFFGLTFVVFITGSDFSWLRTILVVGTFVAFGVLIAGLLIGFNLGLVFSFAMVALASGFILYSTSNVLHHYDTDSHVAAALALFAAVALLFWYILQIVMATRD